MKKYAFLLILISITGANDCAAQDLNKGKFPSSTTNPSKTNKPQPTRPAALTTIRVTTDEACKFKIGNTDYGILNVGDSKNVKLPNGQYSLMAENIKTSDQFLVNITIPGSNTLVSINLIPIRQAREQKEDSLEKALALEDSIRIRASRGQLADEKLQAAVNELYSSLISIPPGSFTMGNNLGANDEGPEHQVHIRAIRIAKYEVTQQQWETIMGTNPSANQNCKDCPVENVSWNEIDSFLIKINQISSQKFRLPTEAEYEYVAFKGGEMIDLDKNAWYSGNSNKKTHPVGTTLPNAFGIYDLAGNVAEWCSDWYKLNYYKRRTQHNPSGPNSGRDKVVRGGSYNDSGAALSRYGRNKQNPNSKMGTIGLRLAMDAN